MLLKYDMFCSFIYFLRHILKIFIKHWCINNESSLSTHVHSCPLQIPLSTSLESFKVLVYFTFKDCQSHLTSIDKTFIFSKIESEAEWDPSMINTSNALHMQYFEIIWAVVFKEWVWEHRLMGEVFYRCHCFPDADNKKVDWLFVSFVGFKFSANNAPLSACIGTWKWSNRRWQEWTSTF